MGWWAPTHQRRCETSGCSSSGAELLLPGAAGTPRCAAGHQDTLHCAPIEVHKKGPGKSRGSPLLPQEAQALLCFLNDNTSVCTGQEKSSVVCVCVGLKPDSSVNEEALSHSHSSESQLTQELTVLGVW